MIKIINYGVGNIRAFANIYRNLGIPFSIASNPDELKGATKLILPGVGHFDYAMSKFKASRMCELVSNYVLDEHKPILGICVGMQMLANNSEEGAEPGLGWIKGNVKKINTHLLTQKTLLPHMGWNNINVQKNNMLISGLDLNSRFYFLHSYYFDCKSNDDILASTTYGDTFTCIVNYKNIYGVQFHPEKSHQYGIKLLENFANIC
jgi:glutamine amidotransferase